MYNNIILFTAQYHADRGPQVGCDPWAGNRCNKIMDGVWHYQYYVTKIRGIF